MNKSICIAAAILAGTAAFAQDATGPVRHATAEWLNFTNRDGTGLYNELFREVFAASGMEVEVNYMPLNRAVTMVESGEMDFTGGFTRDDRLFATHPVYETTYSVIYSSESDIDWTDPAQLDGLRIVGPPQIAAEVEFTMTELESRSQAARMLLAGRADAYIDLHELIETFAETGQVADVDQVSGGATPAPLNTEDWQITEVRTSRLYILFSDNDRGRAMRDLYDSGTEVLFESGRLNEIYSQYGIQTPTIMPR